MDPSLQLGTQFALVSCGLVPVTGLLVSTSNGSEYGHVLHQII
jgi:hypothetical protein